MSIIYTHPSGGKLHQAGMIEIPAILAKHPIKLLILTAQEFQPRNLFTSVDKILLPLNDSQQLSMGEIINTLKLVTSTSKTAADYLKNGKDVLSTCAMGLNRSGITSAYILRETTQLPCNEIISLIRKNRHPAALSNQLFVKLILASCN